MGEGLRALAALPDLILVLVLIPDLVQVQVQVLVQVLVQVQSVRPYEIGSVEVVITNIRR